MGRSIRVAAVQLRAHDRSEFTRALESTLAAVRAAAHEADLVVLPEATYPAYVLGRAPLDEPQIAGAVNALREISRARSVVIVAGVAERRDGAARNGAVVVDADGSIAGRADKLFLWHFDRRWFDRGERIAPVETKVGKLGVLICADGRLPTIARALVDEGAGVLVMPTAWVTSGRDPHALENVQADLLGRVRAFENRVPFVAANKCGAEQCMVAYCGKSQVVDRDGEIVALAGEREPETLYATLTLDDERPLRVAPASPRERTPGIERPLRLAVSFEPLPGDVDERLELLDDAYAVAPGDRARFELLDRVVPLARVDDPEALDPGGLVPYRRAGVGLVCWTSSLPSPWLERIARARAIELRLYLIVFDRAASRAFAVDPDGAILAGTFGDYRLASFTYDPRKVQETAVAPGSDVREGLERVAEILDR